MGNCYCSLQEVFHPDSCHPLTFQYSNECDNDVYVRIRLTYLLYHDDINALYHSVRIKRHAGNWRRIKSLLSLNQPFAMLESPTNRSRLLQAKAVYFLMQLLVMAMGVYKVWVMGLLPTTGSDFLAWKSERPVCYLASTANFSWWNGALPNYTHTYIPSLHTLFPCSAKRLIPTTIQLAESKIEGNLLFSQHFQNTNHPQSLLLQILLIFPYRILFHSRAQ